MKIKKNLTTTNYTKGRTKKIEYIVIHWVGSVSTAKNNSIYFKTENRGASAHFFVDVNDIYKVVKVQDTAWHCGTTGAYKHPRCRNDNSIGIEMCVSKGDVIDSKVIKKTIKLVKKLAKKYKIPTSRILRHYDVTGKNCPAPFVKKPKKWKKFLKRIEG